MNFLKSRHLNLRYNNQIKQKFIKQYFSSNVEEKSSVDPVDEIFEADIRDKSKLSSYLKKIKDSEPTGLPYAYHYKINILRKYYGMHGKSSGLNPGLCFPTPEELNLKVEYESLDRPPLTQVLEIVKEKRNKVVELTRLREERIETNMKKLPMWRKEMLNREAKLKAEIAQRLAKKEEVISEIRNILGYNVNVNDPRFQEMLEKRDEEEKKKRKLAKKEKQKQRLLADLIDTSGGQLKIQNPKDEDSEDKALN